MPMKSARYWTDNGMGLGGGSLPARANIRPRQFVVVARLGACDRSQLRPDRLSKLMLFELSAQQRSVTISLHLIG